MAAVLQGSPRRSPLLRAIFRGTAFSVSFGSSGGGGGGGGGNTFDSLTIRFDSTSLTMDRT